MINHRVINVVCLALLMIFIIGCSSKEWDNPTGDTRDPMVLSVIPPDGAYNVGCGDNIVAFFNRDIDPSTINMGNFFVYNYNQYIAATRGTTSGETTTYGTMPAKVPGGYAYDASQRAAIFSPRYLSRETYYVAILTTSIKDTTGRNMLVGYKWYFTSGW